MSDEVTIHPSWDTLRNKPTDLVTDADLQAALPGVHPDDEDLFEFVNGNPGDGGSGTPYDFGTFSSPALFTLDMGTF